MSAASRRRRRRRAFARRTPPGAPPGTLVADPSKPRPIVNVLAYGPDGYVEKREIQSLSIIPELLAAWPVVWIDVDGLGDAQVVRDIGQIFGLHPLALEDVLHTHQHAKAEHYDGVLFVVLQMLLSDAQWETEQVSTFVGPNFVITFQERPGDCLEPARQRVRSHDRQSLVGAPGLLLHAILDAIIDNYFPLVENCGERLDELESDVLERPDRGAMERIHAVKYDLRLVRRACWPLRDALNTLLRDPSPLITDEARVFLRDCHDHTVQIIDLLENYRDLASSLMDIYLSSLSNSINEVMRVLTVISTIFIPLTFLVGVYGMNFDPDASPWNMPELRWRYGYPLSLALMALIAAWMIVYFLRRGWLRPVGSVIARDRAAPRGAEPASRPPSRAGE